MKPLATLACLSTLSCFAVAESKVDIGGAVRVNYSFKDYSDKDKDTLGEFDFGLFRLDIDARQGDWYLDAQYRWYRSFGFDTIHHAFIGFDVNDNNQVEFGIHQVPFGIEGFASHSFWFSGAYYLGYEDDYDTGIKWRHKGDGYRFETAFYLTSELASNDFNRYSFDVAGSSATGADVNNQESGQINARYVQDLSKDTSVGISVELGRIYNNANQKSANHHAIAFHATHKMGPWDVQFEAIKYAYADDENIGTDDGTIAISGFGYASDIASEGQLANVNVARKFNIKNRLVDTATCYNDFSVIQGTAKANGDHESMQNVTGCMLAKGSIYTYIDWIAGKDMYFIRGKGVGVRDSVGWNSRLNINVGWYF